MSSYFFGLTFFYPQIADPFPPPCGTLSHHFLVRRHLSHPPSLQLPDYITCPLSPSPPILLHTAPTCPLLLLFSLHWAMVANSSQAVFTMGRTNRSKAQGKTAMLLHLCPITLKGCVLPCGEKNLSGDLTDANVLKRTLNWLFHFICTCLVLFACSTIISYDY